MGPEPDGLLSTNFRPDNFSSHASAAPLVPSMCPPAHVSAASESGDRSKLLIEKILNGAEGQNRTADTVIFSHVLYQLSYLGTAGRPNALRTAKIITSLMSHHNRRSASVVRSSHV